MNYYQPREMQKDGKPSGIWHYTVRNDDRIWPTGYCAEGCLGHATPDEAREHYRDYLVDTAHYDTEVRPPGRCQVDGCGRFTARRADVGPGRMEGYMLCSKHMNAESLKELVVAGDSISSY